MKKGVRWMPWHIEQKKDAVNGETPRGDVNDLRSGGIRMGEPNTSNVVLHISKYIAYDETT